VISCEVRLPSTAGDQNTDWFDTSARVPELLQRLVSSAYGRESGMQSPKWEGQCSDISQAIARLSVALQVLAGAEVSFVHSEPLDGGRACIAVGYEVEQAGVESVRLAAHIVRACLSGQPVEPQSAIERVRLILSASRLDASCTAVAQEARRRGIPVRRLGSRSVIQLGFGKNLRRVKGLLATGTDPVAVEVARDSVMTRNLLLSVGLPAPVAVTATTLGDAVALAREMGFPIRVSCIREDQEEPTNHRVSDESDLKRIWQAHGGAVTQFVIKEASDGREYDALVVNHRVRAVVERIHAFVTGDGHSQLLDLIHSDGRLVPSLPEADVLQPALEAQGYSLDAVPPVDERVILPVHTDMSTPPIAIEPRDDMNPTTVAVCETAARVIGLSTAGVRLRSPDIAAEWAANRTMIVGLDPAPDLEDFAGIGDAAVHLAATHVVDRLYPPGRKSTIPIVAITGTNGKTTTARLIAHILRRGRLAVGLKTSDGVYVDDRTIADGEMVSAFAASLLLSNPEVEIAVLETARGGILSQGLGFDHADVGVILNVAGDHLDQEGVYSLEQLARVKRVVAQSVRESGHVVLNADDPLVLAMGDSVSAAVALFSVEADDNNEGIADQIALGRIAVCLQGGRYVIHQRGMTLPVAEVAEVPLAFGGAARFQHANILAAIATAHVLNVGLETIRGGVLSFFPTPAVTPARLNVFNLSGATVLVDYAHNPHALAGLMEMVRAMPAERRIGVVAMAGDRRDKDLREFGRIAAEFDHVIVREHSDLRGRMPGAAARLIADGLREANMPDDRITVILSEAEAVRHALKSLRPRDLLVLLAFDTRMVLELVKSSAASLREPRTPHDAHEGEPGSCSQSVL
jgi:cyanophycin synthetase